MSIDVMKQVLEVMDTVAPSVEASAPRYYAAREALRAAIEQAQEPVAWRWRERINSDFDSWVVTSCEPPPYAVEKQPLYTAPPQRQWQGLQNESQAK